MDATITPEELLFFREKPEALPLYETLRGQLPAAGAFERYFVGRQ